jgi:hypothetical protein
MKSFLPLAFLLLSAMTLVFAALPPSNVETTTEPQLESRALGIFDRPKCGKEWGFGIASCICNAAELSQAIAAIPTINTADVSPTKIALCSSSYITLDSTIDLSNKAIAMQCGGGIFSWAQSKSCVLDGDHITQMFTGHDAWVSIRGVVLINGYVSPPSEIAATTVLDRGGAALKLSDSFLIIDSCRFSNNAAPTGPGGAIHFVGGTMRIASTEFLSNSAMVGGAVSVSNANVDIESSALHRNQAQEGGAMHVQDVTLNVVKTTFFHNDAIVRVSCE